jgi:putative transposase
MVRRHHLYPRTAWLSYLVAIMDWASRHGLSWRLSNSMEASFCLEALEEALQKYDKPGIFNTASGQPIHQPGLYWSAEGS